jgi:hypothetical protein
MKSPSRTAARIALPVIGTISMSSRLPRSISFVTVVANPFHEIKKPSVQRRFRFSSFSRKMTNSSLPHLPLQFLHSAKISADSRLRRGSGLSLRMEMSISSVAVRTRPLIVNPLTPSKSRLDSSSKLRPFSSVLAPLSTASTRPSRLSKPHPETRAAIAAICFPISSDVRSEASSSSAQTCVPRRTHVEDWFPSLRRRSSAAHTPRRRRSARVPRHRVFSCALPQLAGRGRDTVRARLERTNTCASKCGRPLRQSCCHRGRAGHSIRDASRRLSGRRLQQNFPGVGHRPRVCPRRQEEERPTPRRRLIRPTASWQRLHPWK